MNVVMRSNVLLLGVLAGTMCLVLAGCGSEEKIKTGNLAETFPTTNVDPKNETKEEKNKNNEEALRVLENLASQNITTEIPDIIELYSDDSQLVFKNNDTTYSVFNYVDDKITSYSTYVDYKSSLLANEALNEYNKNPENAIEKAYTKGQYLVVEYKESEYIGFSVSELREALAYFQEVKKQN